jgi:membrane protease YdiL (CAAX protease family)
MTLSMWIGPATIIGSLVVGLIAVRNLRRRGLSVRDGLGLSLGTQDFYDLGVGTLIPTIVMIAIFGVELVLGEIHVRNLPLTIIPVLTYSIALLPLAFLEEFISRSLLLSGLLIFLRGRKVLAVLISAIVFGFAHAANPNASILSIIGNSLGGLIYGLAFVWTRRIWLPLGLHFAWNVVQGPILGFPVSGHSMGGMQQIIDVGPHWITGGAYGPEAGLVGILSRLVILAALPFWMRVSGRVNQR